MMNFLRSTSSHVVWKSNKRNNILHHTMIVRGITYSIIKKQGSNNFKAPVTMTRNLFVPHRYFSTNNTLLPLFETKNQSTNNAYYHYLSTVLLLFGTAITATSNSTTSTTTILTFCDDNNDNNTSNDIDKKEIRSILKTDSSGNIDWMASLTQVSDQEFLDTVATNAGSQIQQAIDSGIPTQLSYGFLCGYCSGYTMKTIGRGVSIVFGLGFMSLQTLSYYGYVHVDHGKIKKDVESILDLNQDGKVDKEDAQLMLDQLMEVLSYNLPGGGGFVSGFIGGLRSG